MKPDQREELQQRIRANRYTNSDILRLAAVLRSAYAGIYNSVTSKHATLNLSELQKIEQRVRLGNYTDQDVSILLTAYENTIYCSPKTGNKSKTNNLTQLLVEIIFEANIKRRYNIKNTIDWPMIIPYIVYLVKQENGAGDIDRKHIYKGEVALHIENDTRITSYSVDVDGLVVPGNSENYVKYIKYQYNDQDNQIIRSIVIEALTDFEEQGWEASAFKGKINESYFRFDIDIYTHRDGRHRNEGLYSKRVMSETLNRRKASTS